MECMKCGKKTIVTDSRQSLSGTDVIRVRKCKGCGKVFKTLEWVDDSEDIEEEYRAIHKQKRMRALKREEEE